jgi:hypothetical protein
LLWKCGGNVWVSVVVENTKVCHEAVPENQWSCTNWHHSCRLPGTSSSDCNSSLVLNLTSLVDPADLPSSDYHYNLLPMHSIVLAVSFPTRTWSASAQTYSSTHKRIGNDRIDHSASSRCLLVLSKMTWTISVALICTFCRL